MRSFEYLWWSPENVINSPPCFVCVCLLTTFHWKPLKLSLRIGFHFMSPINLTFQLTEIKIAIACSKLNKQRSSNETTEDTKHHKTLATTELNSRQQERQYLSVRFKHYRNRQQPFQKFHVWTGVTTMFPCTQNLYQFYFPEHLVYYQQLTPRAR